LVKALDDNQSSKFSAKKPNKQLKIPKRLRILAQLSFSRDTRIKIEQNKQETVMPIPQAQL